MADHQERLAEVIHAEFLNLDSDVIREIRREAAAAAYEDARRLASKGAAAVKVVNPYLPTCHPREVEK